MAGCVYLAADSMVTRRGSSLTPLVGKSPVSSFGERHIDTPTLQIHESALKLLRFGNSALALAGDEEIALSFAELFRTQHALHGMASAAFRSILSERPDRWARIALALAAVESHGATLLSFNRLGDDPRVEELGDRKIIQIGTAPDRRKLMVRQVLGALEGLAHDPTASPQAVLAALLAFLHNLGLWDYSVPDGIGGGYVGVVAGPSGVDWQKDIDYVLCNEGEAATTWSVASFVRDNAFYLAAGKTNLMRGFGNWLTGGEVPENSPESRTALAQHITDSQHDFVAFLGTTNAHVTLVEMDKHRESRLLRISPGGLIPEGQPARKLKAFAELARVLQLVPPPNHITLNFFEYEPVDT